MNDPLANRLEINRRARRALSSFDIGPFVSPGLYRLFIVGGAAEEAGWEIDRLLLTRDNRQPPSGAEVRPAESPSNEEAK